MGQVTDYYPVEDKGLSACQHFPFFWSNGSRAGSHLDPLHTNLEAAPAGVHWVPL